MESVRWVVALADQPGLLQPGQGQVKEPVRPPVLQQPVAEVAQHAVVEARIVEVEAERVLEVDPAPHRLGGVAVRQVEQELQHAHRGQLRRRDPGPPVPGIPAGEVLVLPQAVEPVPHPHRRRPGRVAGPRHPRGQLRDLDPQAGTDRHHALLRDLAGLISPQDWPRASLQSAKYQDSRQSQASEAGRRVSSGPDAHRPPPTRGGTTSTEARKPSPVRLITALLRVVCRTTHPGNERTARAPAQVPSVDGSLDSLHRGLGHDGHGRRPRRVLRGCILPSYAVTTQVNAYLIQEN